MADNNQENSKSFDIKAWLADRIDEGKVIIKMLTAILFIVSGVAIGMFAFGYINPPKAALQVMGAISIAFSAALLGQVVYAGVKSQSNNKRRK